jgi:hypothetical protein
MSNYLVYSKFYTAQDARSLVELLQQHRVPYKMEHETNQLDAVFIGDGLDPMYALKIPQKKFALVNELIAAQTTAGNIANEEGHYLDDFSDKELLRILEQPNEWNAFDINYAKEMLVERGVVAAEFKPRYGSADSYKPESISTPWIIFGYLFSTLAITGIFVGLTVINARKILPNGVVVKVYDQRSILHGKIFFVIGIISTILVGARVLGIISWLSPKYL